MDSITLGIDASNIRVGGGLTHLRQLLHAAQPWESSIRRVGVGGSRRPLDELPERRWLEKVHVFLLDQPLPARLFWQQILLPRCLLRRDCDVLLSPGGTLPWRTSSASVVISQNLLPFETEEAARFGLSFKRLKLALLRRAQSSSMKRADGLIFGTRYARAVVLSALGHPVKPTAIIPHGIEDRFFHKPRPVLSLSEFDFSNPFKIIYVSTVDVYKHQWEVVKAVGLLRKRGLPVELDLVGPAYPPARKRLRAAIAEVDPSGSFVHYSGPVPFRELHEVYRWADAFVFASSCETLPNILLEAMAAGLPIACSDRGPMPEVLGNAGVYFDPERSVDIAEALQRLVEDDGLRLRLARRAYARATGYSWEKCAATTFSYVAKCTQRIKPPGHRRSFSM